MTSCESLIMVYCLWLALSFVVHIDCQPKNLLFEAYSSVNRLSLDKSFPDEQRLIYELLAAYDTAARPVFNASKNVIIDLSLSLIQISDMDERNQILTANVWIEQEWLDERLSWNRSKYNNLDKLRIPCNRLWLPDIVLYNSADDYNKGFMQSKAMVKPDGRVFWPLPIKLRSSCKIDVTYFPFDDQVCSWKFGSWTYSGLQIDLHNLRDNGDLTNYVESGEWALRSVTAVKHTQYYPCCPNEPYPDITFHISIRRRILYFLFNIIIPCVWLSILSLIGFLLPPDSGEKITLGITVLLAFSVFMLLIAENIPATSETVPLIVIYLTSSMSLTSISIILTVILFQLHHAGNYAPTMSRGFYYFITRRAAILVGMRGTVKRYEKLKQMQRRHTRRDISASSSQQKYSEPNQISNITFLSSFKKSQTSTNKQHKLSKHRMSNGFITTASNPDNRNFHYVDKNCKIHGLSRHIDSASLYEVVNNHQSVTLPLINCDTTETTPCDLHMNNEELLRNIKKLNNGVKHLLSRDAELISNINANEWKLVGIIMDRVIFWSFFTMTCIASSCLLIIFPTLKHNDII